MQQKLKTRHFLILQIAVACLFLGRAWQHLVWDAPYRVLLWDQQWMESIITTITGFTWEEYITSMKVDDWITIFIKSIGAFYLFCFLVTILLRKYEKWMGVVLKAGGFSLIFLAMLYWKEKFYSVAQLAEYTIQFMSPLFLVFAVKHREITPRFILYIKIAIALTFTAHGLYALNVFPRPGIFMEMTMNILGVGEEGAILFLNVAGILDLVLSVGIFLPWRYSKIFLAYACFWGLLTALARITAFFHWETALSTLSQWLHETVIRLPHFLIPFFVLVVLHTYEKGSKTGTT